MISGSSAVQASGDATIAFLPPVRISKTTGENREDDVVTLSNTALRYLNVSQAGLSETRNTVTQIISAADAGDLVALSRLMVI
jgi:hypothetical protein